MIPGLPKYNFLFSIFSLYSEAEYTVNSLKTSIEFLPDYKQKELHLLRDLMIKAMTPPEERHRFELLRRAYIDARYKKEYEISKEDLEYLSKRVEVLRELVKVKEVCEGKVG